MKKIILVMVTMCCLMVCGCGNNEIQSETPTETKSSVKPIEVKDVVEEAEMTTTPTKSIAPHTKECNHHYVEDEYGTDWGYYEGYVCTKCGEGRWWLTISYEETKKAVDIKDNEDIEDVTNEKAVKNDEYDWETYEKSVEDKVGFNKDETDTEYLYNEEYFYDDYYDHSNVDLVYDEDIANSYPPYNEKNN